MSEWKYAIYFPGEECRDKTVANLERCARLHAEISKKALGHKIVEPEWLVFDDCLSLAYDQMQKTLAMLDEKVG